jgi:hypothetical protein
MIGIGVAWMSSGCFERHRPAWDGSAESDRPASAAVTAPAVPVTSALTRTSVPAIPVEQWAGPGDRRFAVAGRTAEREAGQARRFGSITLPTALRSRPLGQYPCTSCHLGRKVVMADERIADAHDDIQPVHPAETGAVCSTCHAADDVASLPLKNGGRATLDESYRLCAQCHFQQVKAWAGGAHGKRLDGWDGPRIVMGCGECHDPHRPAVEQRVPFRPPHIQRVRTTTDEH